MIATTVHQAVNQLLSLPRTDPDPAPAPPDGAGALVTLLSWIKWVH